MQMVGQTVEWTWRFQTKKPRRQRMLATRLRHWCAIRRPGAPVRGFSRARTSGRLATFLVLRRVAVEKKWPTQGEHARAVRRWHTHYQNPKQRARMTAHAAQSGMNIASSASASADSGEAGPLPPPAEPPPAEDCRAARSKAVCNSRMAQL